MTTYYVRKTGSDAAAGTSAGAAWLTVDKAANTVAAGDIVWIGAGVYRETVTIDTSGTNGSEIEWRADIDGAMTGDPGLVVITKLSDEIGGGGTGNVLNIDAKEYNEFYDIVFGPAGTGTGDITVKASTGNANYQGVLFEGCVFLPPADTNNDTITLNYNAGAAISGAKLTFQNCYIGGTLALSSGTVTSDSACGARVINCVFSKESSGITSAAIVIDGASSGSAGITGFEVTNNTFIWDNIAIQITDQWGTGTIGTIANNLFQCGNIGMSIASDSGTWVGYNNKCTSEQLVSGGASYTGTNDAQSVGSILGLYVEHIYRRWYGWTPYGAHEQVWDRKGSGYKSGGIDTGNATYAPATDIYGNPRPMGAADDVGAVEANPRGARSATWAADGSTYSMAFTSIGYYESMIPVDAVSTTVTVVAYKDASYAGTAPKLEVLIGDTSQGTDSMVVAVEVEETLSVNFTPSSAGWARVRLYSYATAGTVYFDSLAVA